MSIDSTIFLIRKMFLKTSLKPSIDERFGSFQ